jgi:hypothetical protein
MRRLSGEVSRFNSTIVVSKKSFNCSVRVRARGGIESCTDLMREDYKTIVTPVSTRFPCVFMKEALHTRRFELQTFRSKKLESVCGFTM